MKKNLRFNKESGLTMIELMIAMTVLAVGLAGIMAIVIASLSGNAKNRTDTASTMLSQMVIEQMAEVPASANTTLTVTDCAGIAWNISTAVGGATLKTTSSSPAWVIGDIDFNVASSYGAAPGNGYGMLYTTCGTNGSTGLTYDVRWNVQTSGGGTTKRVVVAARIRGTAGTTAGGAQSIYFAIPAQLKTVLGT